MSNKIDQRIVEMSFENSKFEKGIHQSKNSLSEFNNALKHTTKNDFSGLDTSVKDLSRSFSAFEQIAIGALRQIGASIANTAAGVFKSLAIEPVTQGFEEMELKMNSTQTIMASTGETLATVNGYLQELNEYSDKTIYSFSDMTKNIGKFTNAGVKLDLAVASIKGISNAAALSGANADEASRAMYNFAQALSAGYVKLIDWKSIENANMATVEFKQQLLDSAVAAGTVTKQADGMYKVLTKNGAGKTMKTTISATRNFNDALAYQWMTTKVLTKTLADYADETTDIGRRASQAATEVTTFTKLMDTLKESVGSGWAQSFELIFGDFNEQKKLWTGVNNALGEMINNISDSRNALLSGGLSSGWKQFLGEGISNIEAFENTLAVVAGEAGVKIDEMVVKAGTMEQAVRENWVTGDMLTETVGRMATSIENLSEEELRAAGYTEKTKAELLALRDALLSGTISAEEFAKKMGMLSGRENIIQGIKNSVVALLQVLLPVSQAFDQIFPPMTANRFKDITEAFKNFTAKLIVGDEIANKIKRTFAGFFAVIDIGWQTIKFLGSAIFEVVKAILPLGDSLLSTTATFGDFLVNLNRFIKSSKVFQYGLLAVRIAILLVREAISSVVVKVKDFVVGLLSAEDPLAYLGDLAKKVFGGLLENIKMVVTWITTKFSKAIGVIQNFLTSKFGTNNIFTVILNGLKDFVSIISGKAAPALTAFGETLKNLDFSKIAIFVAGGALLLLVKQISDLTGSFTNLTKSFTGVVKDFRKKFLSSESAIQIRDIALAIGVLAASLWVLSTIPAEQLERSFISLAKAIGVFVGAYAALAAINIIASKTIGDKEVKTAWNLINVSFALVALASILKILSSIDTNKINTSIVVLGAMVGIIVAYQVLSAFISKIPNQQKSKTNVFSMAAGLLAMVGVFAILNKFSIPDLLAGIGKLTILLAVLSAVQFVFGLAAKVGGGNKVSINILSMATGILSLIAIVKLLSSMNQQDIVNNLGKIALMALTLGGVEIVMGIAGRVGGGKKFKTNMLTISLGMLAMVGLIALISLIDQKDVNKGLIALAAMGGIIGGIQVLSGLAALLGGTNKLQKNLGSVTFAMLAFTGIIAILATPMFANGEVNRGLNAIRKMAEIIIAIEFATALAAKFSGGNKLWVPLAGVVGAMLAVTASLVLLSMVDQDALRKSSISLSIAIAAVVALSVGVNIITRIVGTMGKSVTGFGNTVKTLSTTLPSIITVLAATGVFFIALRALLDIVKEVQWDDLRKFIVGIGVVSLLFMAFDDLSKVNTNLKGSWNSLVPGLIGIVGVLAATGAFFLALKLVLPIIKDMEWGDLGKFVTGLGVVVLLLGAYASFSKVLALSGASGTIGPALLGLLGALAALVLVLGTFVGIAALLQQIPVEVLITGFNNLAIVGEGIGRFIGSMVSGFSIELLTGIGEGIAGFVNAVEGLNFGALSGLKDLASALLTISAANVVEGLGRLINFGKTPMSVFTAQISELVTAFSSMSASEVQNSSAVLVAATPMATALKSFAEVAGSIPNSGGILGGWMGENDINDFGKKLGSFISVFGGSGGRGSENRKSQITEEGATQAAKTLSAATPMATALKDFTEVAKTIPNSGGELGAWMGENDINDFGAKLGAFIGIFAGVLPVGRNAILLDEATATQAAATLAAATPMTENLKRFAEESKHIPNSGGILAAWMGENEIDEFGRKLGTFINVFGGSEGRGAGRSMPQITEGGAAKAAKTLVAATPMAASLEAFALAAQKIPGSGWLKNLVTGDATLSSFAAELGKFVNNLSGIDFTVVQPAMEALETITKLFETTGSIVLENAKQSFENNKEPFQKAIVSIIDEVVTKLKGKKEKVVGEIKTIFEYILKTSRSYIKDFVKLGEEMVNGLNSGMTSKKKATENAANNMMSSVIRVSKKTAEISSPSKVFMSIGAWCAKGLANGIKMETDTAVNAGKNLATALEEGVRDVTGVHSESKIYFNIGDWIAKALGNGISLGDGKNWLLGQAQKLGIDTGNITVDSLVNSFAGGDGMVTGGIKSLLGMLTGDSSIINAAGGVGGAIGKQITDSLNSSIDGSDSSSKKSVKTLLDKLKSYIEEETFYGRMSLEEELKAYEAFSSAFKGKAEERKELDREIYRLTKSIYEAQISYIKDVEEAQQEAHDSRMKLDQEYNKDVTNTIADSEKKLADLRKKYDKDTTSARTDAAKKTQDAEKKHYENMNKILEKAEEDRQTTRERYADNQRNINEKLLSDIDAQNKAYEDAVKSRADTIYGAYGLFAKVEPDEEITGEELLGNLRDQGAALSEWEQSLNALAERGVGTKLIEELQKMGPASKAQIKALLTLTDEQLTEYVGLFEGKYTFARKKAEIELEGLKNSTEQAIKDLNAQAAVDLDVLANEFSIAMSTIDSNMAMDMEKLRATHQETLAEIQTDLQEKLTELELNWSESSAEINADQTEKLQELREKYDESTAKINEDVEKKLKDLKENFSSTMRDVNGLTLDEMRKLIAENKTKLTQLNTDTTSKLNEVKTTFDKNGKAIVSSFGSNMQTLNTQTSSGLNELNRTVTSSLNEATDEFEQAGRHAAMGFAGGIRNGTYMAEMAAEFLARQAVSTARRVLDERSPSRVFSGIGRYVSMGFATGITDKAYLAEQASRGLTEGSISIVAQALSELDESDDLGWEPVITPVLDLSNIKSNDVSKLLSSNVQLGGASRKMANDTIQNGSNGTAPMQNIINNFNLSGLTVRSEADTDLIATKLFQKQQAAQRGRGIRNPTR